MYIFESIDEIAQKIFQIRTTELDYLCEKQIFQTMHQRIYFFDHDIIRQFFYTKHRDCVLNCLEWLHNQKKIIQI